MSPTNSARLQSLDAFRGFIMLLMASSGLGVAQMAAAHPGTWWEVLRPQFEHKVWQGCSLWDLIQPSFMFMVGLAVPFSSLKRRENGQGFLGMAWHALVRSLVLIALGVMLATRAEDKHTVFLFTNVLAQIGLGYFFLFLLSRMGVEYMVAGILLILAGYSWFFIQHPLPSGAELAAVAALKGTQGAVLEGWAGHWSIHTNAAAAFDRWFLNLLPRDQPFQFNPGGYQTLNFVPALATMLGGAVTGEFLIRSVHSEKRKMASLVIAGVVLLLVGTILDLTHVMPAVKRIWTPSWALVSGGGVLLLLALFYAVVEIAGQRWLVFPLVVVGMNSIFIYLLHSLGAGWIREHLHKHLPEAAFPAYWAPVVDRVGVVLVLWLVCFWLYRQRAFLKL